MNSTNVPTEAPELPVLWSSENHSPAKIEDAFCAAPVHRSARSSLAANPIVHSNFPRILAGGKIRSLALSGPAGRLEAILNSGLPEARFAALVCHPHPSFGGTLHNKVVYHAMKALNERQWGFGCPVLRFNFRGAGLSEGSHDGEAETGDVLAAMDWLEREFRLPLIVAGFSFGAAMVLRACSAGDHLRHDVRALAALGLPINANSGAYHYPFLKDLAVPKLFLSGGRDEFSPAAQLDRVVASAAEPKRLVLISGADHFFSEHLGAMQNALATWLKEQLQ